MDDDRLDYPAMPEKNRCPAPKKYHLAAATLGVLVAMAAAWYFFRPPPPLPVAAAGMSQEEFFAQVASGVHLVDFMADWCGPCRMQKPILEKVAGAYRGRATLSQINVDANPVVATHFAIRSIPCLIFFKNGREETRLIGLRSEEELAGVLDALLR